MSIVIDNWVATGHCVERQNGSLVCECVDYTLAHQLASFPELLAVAENLLAAYREDHAALVEACNLHGVLENAEPSDLAYIGKMRARIEQAERAIDAARGGQY